MQTVLSCVFMVAAGCIACTIDDKRGFIIALLAFASGVTAMYGIGLP